MQRSPITTRTIACFTYVFLLHLFLVVVLWKSNFIEKIEAKFNLSGPILSFHEQMTVYHKTMDGSIPEGSILFLGDSITQALATSAVSNHSINLGIGADTTGGVIERLPLYKSIDRASAVVLAIGINDIHQGINRRDTLANYKKILEYMPSSVTVVASSVISIGSGAEREGFTNADIVSLNKEIENISKTFENVVYLDTSVELMDDAGYLREEFHIGDGVHLSDDGYATLIKILKDVLVATNT